MGNAHSRRRVEERLFGSAHISHPRVHVAEKKVLLRFILHVVHRCLCLVDGGKKRGSYPWLNIATNNSSVDGQVERSLVLGVSIHLVVVPCRNCPGYMYDFVGGLVVAMGSVTRKVCARLGADQRVLRYDSADGHGMRPTGDK